MNTPTVQTRVNTHTHTHTSGLVTRWKCTPWMDTQSYSGFYGDYTKWLPRKKKKPWPKENNKNTLHSCLCRENKKLAQQAHLRLQPGFVAFTVVLFPKPQNQLTTASWFQITNWDEREKPRWPPLHEVLFWRAWRPCLVTSVNRNARKGFILTSKPYLIGLFFKSLSKQVDLFLSYRTNMFMF